MMHILAEKPFLSIQGEGIHAGRPSIFVRYAGCNLRCQFGLKCKNCNKVRDIPDYIQNVIDNIDDYNNVEDLPVFPTYCDTYIGILPEFRRFWINYETKELVDYIVGLVKDNENYKDLTDIDIVFTGGEPMLHQDKMLALVKELSEYNLNNVTIETNGTLPIKEELYEQWVEFPANLTFSVSPKISSANYTIDDTCIPEAIKSYSDLIDTANEKVVLKFVVQNESDIPMVLQFVERYKEAGCFVEEICLMPCGGKADPDFEETQREVFDLCVKYNFRYSPRLQMIKLNSWGV